MPVMWESVLIEGSENSSGNGVRPRLANQYVYLLWQKRQKRR